MAESSTTREALALCDRAMELDRAERDEFIAQSCRENPALEAAVQTIMRALTDAGDFLRTDSETAATVIGSTIGAFRIVDEIGVGGMGAVYLGERNDGQFEQKVAVKLVRGQFLHPELARRFDAERQILAGLNHPYIAALLDGGRTLEGTPYLIMELVDGVPVNEYCDREQLDLEQRIALVRKICLAVQAAHQNLVIHRDLKPSNVLVTEDGIPKLLDFGIAKLINTDSAETADQDRTMLGQQALTPNYASPEQILENRVTTASDVYSLGVLCYELLAGERPYDVSDATHQQLVERISGLTIPRPSTRLARLRADELRQKIADNRSTTPVALRKRLSGDLDNVLMKALDIEPSKRYGSAAAFADDLHAFGKGLPVTARADSPVYRMTRFAGRHKFGVAASSALALSLLAGLGASTWAYLQAEQARSEADERFEQVRNIANTMMFDVYDQVSKLPGSTRAQELLAKSAQGYLSSLSETGRNSAPLQLDLGRGYARLAEVIGGVDQQSLGDRETAVDYFRLAEETLTKLCKKYPDNNDYRTACGTVQAQLAAHALYSDNNVETARGHALLAVEHYERVLPPNTDSLLGLAQAKLELADTYDWGGDFAKSADVVREVIMLIDESIDTNPERHYRGTMMKAKAYRDLGSAVYYLDEIEESVRLTRIARDLNRAALAYADDRQVAARSLAITLFNLAGAEADGDTLAAALASIDEGKDIAKRLYDDNRVDRGSLNLLQSITQQRSTILSVMGRHAEAIPEARLAYDLQVELNAKSSADAHSNRETLIEMFNLGYVNLQGGQIDEGCGWVHQSMTGMQTKLAAGSLSAFDEETLLPDVKAAFVEHCEPPVAP